MAQFNPPKGSPSSISVYCHERLPTMKVNFFFKVLGSLKLGYFYNLLNIQLT